MQSYANPQSLNRYSYVMNNPLRYTDPTGHMRTDEQCGSNKEQCSHLGASSGWNGKVIRRTDKTSTHTGHTGEGDRPVLMATVTPIPTSTSSITNLMSTFPAQCTSSPCIGNFVPSATPSPTSTPLPLISGEDVKNLAPYFAPPNLLKPSFAPNIDDLWDRFGTTLPPLFNIPAINSNIIVNRIVDGATNAARIANNVLVNYSEYIISGGISPTLPIVPYVPSANPFGTVYQ